MNQNDFRASVMGFYLGDDIRFSPAPLRYIGEELFVQEMNRPKVDLPRDLGIEQLQKIPEVGLQNRFEKLIVIHIVPMPLKE